MRYTAGVSGDVNGGSDTRFGGLQIRGFDMTMPGLYLDGLRLPSQQLRALHSVSIPMAPSASKC